MKQQTKKLISYAVILILVALAIYYLRNNLHEFKQLTLTNYYLFPLLIVLALINYTMMGTLNKELLSALGVKIPQKESFQLSIVGGFYNLITPMRGGMAARAVYLKRKYSFSYTNFLAMTAATFLLVFFVAGLFGLTASYFIFLNTREFSRLIVAIFAIAFIGTSFVMMFSPKLPETKSNFINRFIKVINGWHLISGNRRVIFSTLVISLAQILIGAVMLILQFRMFSVEISFVQGLFLASIGSLGLLIAITPAGLGINEAVTVFSAATIGITPAQSLSAALLGRVVSLVVLFILGPIYSYKLIRKGNGNGNEKGESKGSTKMGNARGDDNSNSKEQGIKGKS